MKYVALALTVVTKAKLAAYKRVHPAMRQEGRILEVGAVKALHTVTVPLLVTVTRN